MWTYIPNTFVCLLCQSVCYTDRTLSKTDHWVNSICSQNADYSRGALPVNVSDLTVCLSSRLEWQNLEV